MSNSIAIILCCYLATIPIISSYTPPINKGLEIRVCMDKDCQLDGSKQTLQLVESLTPTTSSDNDDNQIVVEKCGCLGPCGSGPTIDFRRDGIRLKDTRNGMDNYFLFRKMNSKQAVVDMLRIGDIELISLDTSTDMEQEVTNTRQWYDIDRNQRIRIQQLLYAITAVPLIVAYKSGEWNESYAFVAVAVFVASQFMGTSKTSNAVVEDKVVD